MRRLSRDMARVSSAPSQRDGKTCSYFGYLWQAMPRSRQVKVVHSDVQRRCNVRKGNKKTSCDSAGVLSAAECRKRYSWGDAKFCPKYENVVFCWSVKKKRIVSQRGQRETVSGATLHQAGPNIVTMTIRSLMKCGMNRIIMILRLTSAGLWTPGRVTRASPFQVVIGQKIMVALLRRRASKRSCPTPAPLPA